MGANAELTRRDLLRTGAVGFTALSGVGLAACGSSGSGTSSQSSTATASGPAQTQGPSSAGTPARGGTLTVGVQTGGPSETIDVRKVINTPDYLRTQQLYDALFFPAPSGVAGGVYPGLAVSAEPNASATVWTFHLRGGVVWHDGKPFSADDVIYTMKASWASSVNLFSPLALALIDFNGIRKRDSLTVEVPLKQGIAQFPSLTTYVNEWIVQNGTKNYSTPIGTGPFKFGSFTPGKSSTFYANKDYWGGAPFVDTLVVDSSFADDPSRLNALIAGQIDIAPSVTQSLARADASQMVVGNATGPAFIPLNMRADEPPYSDVRVRKALKMVMDRPQYVSQVFDGYATVGNDLPGATLEYFASDLRPAHDPEQAQHLLKSAGYDNLNLKLITAEFIPGVNETATLFASQAKAAGVTVHLDQISPATYFSSAPPAFGTNARPFSMDGWNDPGSTLTVFYLQTLSMHADVPETAWSPPSFETLLNDALADTNKATAADKWHAVQATLFEQGAYLIPANINFVDGYGTRVRGVETNSAGPCADFVFHKAWLAT